MNRLPRLRPTRPALSLAATLLVVGILAGTTLAAGAPPHLETGSTEHQLLTYVTGAATESVWLADLDGSSAHRLGAGDEPRISPAGTYVAAAIDASSGPTMRLYSTEALGSRSFFSSRGSSAVPLAWSPDSRYLAVQLYGDSVTSNRGSGLAILDTRTFTTTMVVTGQIYGASFAPGSSDRLVYASARSESESAPVNLHTVNANGTGGRQITADGRSLNPVWGAKGIAFDRERSRGPDSAPVYQVWLMNGTQMTQLTHLKVPQLLEGLVPEAVSTDGNRLLAGYEGQDTDYAWTIQLDPLEIRQVKVGGELTQGMAISADGTSLLLDTGAFENSPSHGTVLRVPFGGGPAVKLVRGSQASWSL